MTNSNLKHFQITKNTESILRICRIFHYINVLSKRPAFNISISKTIMDLILVREFGQNNDIRQDDVLIQMGLTLEQINNGRVLLYEFQNSNSKNSHKDFELFRVINLAITLEDISSSQSYSHEFKLSFSDCHLLNAFCGFQKNVSTFPTNWNVFLISINHLKYTNNNSGIPLQKIVK